MPTVIARQKLWSLKREVREIAKALPDEQPQRGLKFTQPGDRVLVLRYLYEVAQKRIDPELWARLNPKEYERLLEICPLKKVAG